MADLRIVDAPEIPTENITGEEKLPTGGSGNYSISLDSVADYTKTKKDLVDTTTVDGKVNGVRQELNTHIEDLLNPHQVTKGQIGLGNVDNTADADKPVSNSTQAAIISAVAPKADKTYVDGQDSSLQSQINQKAETEYVDNALSNLSTVANRFYPTLAEANADIANLAVNQPVQIGEVANGGLWYKATAGETSLTKSPYDPLTQAKAYTDAAEVNAKTYTDISSDKFINWDLASKKGSYKPTAPYVAGYLSATGAVSPNAVRSVSDFTAINPTSILTVNAENAALLVNLCLYDINKNFVTYRTWQSWGINKPLTIPDNARYARFTVLNEGVDTFTVNLVSTAIAAITERDEMKFLHDFYGVGGGDIQKLLAERYYTAERFLVTNTGVMRVTTDNRNAYVTNYYTIDPDANEIVVSGWSIGGATALYAFYDSDYECLSAPAGESGGVQVKTILKEDIPVGAEYIRYTGWKGGYSYITGATPIVSESATEALFYDVLSKRSVDRLRGLAEINNPTLGFYITGSGTITAAGTFPLLTASDFLVLDKSVDTLSVSGHGKGLIQLFAIYDINKNVLMTSIGSGTGNHIYSVDMSTLPPGSHYIRFTGWQGYESFVQGTIETPLIEDIAQIVSNLTPPPSISHKLNSIFITGASFTYSGNTWFGKANDKLGTTGVNKARNGVGRPTADAELFWRETMVTDEQFEDIDVFSFMYANVRDLDSEEGLKEKAEDYTANFDLDAVDNPFTTYSEAQCMDYILKHLQGKCYAQKDNPDSKWFGTQHGKPFNVMFVTSWHDGRPYNSIPVRVLAAKWGAAVCELDKKIGFSKDKPLPDGKQVSIIYAEDTQVIDGITYGWHPKRGASSEYIQNKIATIYKQSIIEYFGD